MFLVVIEKVADTTWMIVVAFIVQGLCFQYFSTLRESIAAVAAQNVEEFDAANTDATAAAAFAGTITPPDYRFGYTYEELYEFYDAIGEEGCVLYQRHAMVDLFPYMQSYALVGGAFLLQQLRPLKLNTKIALIFPMAMMMDMLETCIPAYGCNIYPRKLKHEAVEAAAAANKLKWTQFGIGMVLLSVLFVYNSVRPPAPSQTTTSSETDTTAEGNASNTKKNN